MHRLLIFMVANEVREVELGIDQLRQEWEVIGVRIVNKIYSLNHPSTRHKRRLLLIR